MLILHIWKQFICWSNIFASSNILYKCWCSNGVYWRISLQIFNEIFV